MEEWRDIKEYKGYKASNLGRIMTPSSKIYNNYQSIKHKYFVLRFKNGDVVKNEPVHRVIARVFIPNIDGNPIVNHKNGDTVDNNAENLEWVTYAENTQHYHRELKNKMSSVNIGTKTYNDGDLIRQSNFAKFINQSPVRIHYLVATQRIKTIEIGGVKFIENSEENINIAKRKSNAKN
jgi:hypothetical protein